MKAAALCRTCSLIAIIWVLCGGHAAYAAQIENQIDLDLPLASTPWRLGISDSNSGPPRIVASFSEGKFTVWDPTDLDNPLFSVTPTIQPVLATRARGVAISPDGRTIAFSVPATLDGSVGARIYLYDTETREHVENVEKWLDIPTAAASLAFSPDGKMLAAGLENGSGVQLWDWRSAQIVWSRDGLLGDVNAVSFSKKFDLLVAGGDYGLILLDVSDAAAVTLVADRPWQDLPITFGSGEPEVSDQNCTRVFGKITALAFAPDQPLLAVATRTRVRETGGISVLKLPTLEVAQKLTVKLASTWKQFLSRVAWSNNGKYVYTAGRIWTQGAAETPFSYRGNGVHNVSGIVRWDVSGVPGDPVFIPTIGSETIMDLQPHGDAGVVYLTKDPVLGIYDLDGNRQLHGEAFDFRGDFIGEPSQFAISKDGMTVSIESLRRGEGFTFDLTTMSLVSARPERNEALIPRVHDASEIPDWITVDSSVGTEPDLDEGKRPNWYLADQWKRRLQVRDANTGQLASVSAAQKDCIRAAREISRSYTLLDGGSILWGTSEYLHVLDGPRIARLKRITHGAWRVLANDKGDLAVVAHADGTIRWYDIADDFELLATLYVNRHHDWVGWTPDGYYATNSNPNDIKILRENPFRNDVTRISLEADRARLNDHNAIRTTVLSRGLLVQHDPRGADIGPTIDIVEVAAVDPSHIKVKYRINKTIDDPPTELEFNLSCQEAAPIPHGNEYPAGIKEVTLRIPPECRTERTIYLEVTAKDRSGVGRGAELIENPGDTVAPPKPKLYALVVGNDFDDTPYPAYKLLYAKKDAAEFAKLLCAQQGSLWGEVVIYSVGPKPVIDCLHADSQQEVSIKNIKDGVRWLGNEAKNNLSPNDAIMLYLAGHAHKTDDFYYFWTRETDPHDKDNTSLVDYELIGPLQNRGQSNKFPRIFVFMDTCRSQTTLPFNSYSVFSIWHRYDFRGDFFAATKEGLAYEDRNTNGIKHGVFTHFLLQGLRGDADVLDTPGSITKDELQHFLKTEVTSFARDTLGVSQKPYHESSGRDPEYVLGLKPSP